MYKINQQSCALRIAWKCEIHNSWSMKLHTGQAWLTTVYYGWEIIKWTVCTQWVHQKHSMHHNQLVAHACMSTQHFNIALCCCFLMFSLRQTVCLIIFCPLDVNSTAALWYYLHFVCPQLFFLWAFSFCWWLSDLNSCKMGWFYQTFGNLRAPNTTLTTSYSHRTT